MSFSMKPMMVNNDGPSVDWEAVNAQVEEGPNPARISLIVDLGIQKRGKGVSYEGKDDSTYVSTEEEARSLVEEATEIMGEYLMNKHSLNEITNEDADGFVVPFKIYEKKDAQEIAIFADLPDTRVEYVEGDGEKQYRIMLNPQFMGEVRGFSLSAVPPKTKGGVWTFDSKSKLAKLAKATGHKEILEEGEALNDIGLILGEAFLLNIEKTKGFVNAKDVMPLMKGMTVEELDNPAVGLSFSNATVELLEAAHLRKAIIDKIKSATNYSGSNMQKAIEAYEANRGFSKEENKVESKPVKKVVEQEEDDFDDLVPF